MRKVLTFLTASLVLAWVAPVMAQQAPDQFKDVEPNHWAYQAMESLRAKGIVVGYPDGYFRGRRTLTRYEFAVALDRALNKIQTTPGMQGPAGPAGAAGPAGPAGEAGVAGKDYDPAEIDALKKLTREFKDELGSMGNSVSAINAKLDALAKDVAAIKEAWDKAPKLSGQAFVGVRADRAHGPYIDRNFAVQPQMQLFRTPTVVHAFELGVDAKVGGGSTVAAKVVADNYLGSIGGNAAQNGTFNNNASGEIYLDQLEIKTPLAGVGREGSLSIGRFSVQGAKYMLWKPDVDVYFDNPMVDDGMYRVDGLKIASKIGSVGVELVGAELKSVQTTGGIAINSPFLGAMTGVSADQMVSLSAKLPVRVLDGGYIRAAALGLSHNSTVVPAGGITTDLVLGVDGALKVADRINVSLDWAKSIEGFSDFRTVTGGASMNSAVEGKVGYGVGALKVAAGYKYIDPLFYSPGNWDRVGYFLNMNNIKGPTVCASYSMLGDQLGVNVGGEFLSGATHLSGLMPEDAINKIQAGVRYNLTKSVRATVDWEGDYIKSAGAGVHPTMQYLTIGTGYNLTSSTLIKIGYEIGDVNGKGVLGTFAGGPDSFNYNVLTTQVAVKF